MVGPFGELPKDFEELPKVFGELPKELPIHIITDDMNGEFITDMNGEPPIHISYINTYSVGP